MIPRRAWRHRVVLTGWDGFSPDKASSFAPTPQSYNFGVCATASGDAHCTFDPNRVPKAMDVLTPLGVRQSVDYTLHNPVTLQGVTIPREGLDTSVFQRVVHTEQNLASAG